MSDVKDILGIGGGGGGPQLQASPPKQVRVKKPEGMSRESWNLLGRWSKGDGEVKLKKL